MTFPCVLLHLYILDPSLYLDKNFSLCLSHFHRVRCNFRTMGRVKKGSKAHRKDLWAMAGGMEALARTLKSANIANRDTDYSSKIWSELSTLTLPGGGQSAPPLPICEMLTNEHSVPPITFWLMQFLRKLSQYTKLTSS